MTKPKKTIRQLAEEHWNWLEPILELQYKSHMLLMRKLCIDEFIHGYKHGKRDRKDGTADTKKDSRQ